MEAMWGKEADSSSPHVQNLAKKLTSGLLLRNAKDSDDLRERSNPVFKTDMRRYYFILTASSALILSAFLTACASSLPSNFVYETSLRGEQGLPGQAKRAQSAQSFLEKNNVADPKAALEAALPDAEIEVKRWGLKYFGSDWTRYKVVLDADIEFGETKTRCRETSTATPVGAPTLNELLENDGAEFGRQIEALARQCIRLRLREINGASSQ